MNVISSVLLERIIYISGTSAEDLPESRLIHMYSLKERKWSTLPEAPIYNAAIGIKNDQITLLGGHDAETHEPTNIAWSWFEKEGQWRHSTLSPMPRARMAIAICYYDNMLLVAGGGEENGTDSEAVKTVDVFFPHNLNYNYRHTCTLPL